MISFNYETNFQLENEAQRKLWISDTIANEECLEGDINYIFCDDEYLLNLNQEYLDHDTLTDIISFDYTVGKELHGDIFISIERVLENAKKFEVKNVDEVDRVMIHGILHYCGYKDKSDDEKSLMRSKEDFYLS
ncbi:MAG: rRNA maturation RNase YbeY, partial [Psychroserpens sp.]|nr:rRNA maturation RNase YbeY [Psychroserpens sp.]